MVLSMAAGGAEDDNIYAPGRPPGRLRELQSELPDPRKLLSIPRSHLEAVLNSRYTTATTMYGLSETTGEYNESRSVPVGKRIIHQP